MTAPPGQACRSPRPRPRPPSAALGRIHDLRDSIHLHEPRDLLPADALDAEGALDPDAALRGLP